MEKEKRKKIIIIGIIVFLVIISSIIFFLLLKDDETVYPETPIIQETLYGYEESQIDMSNLPFQNFDNFKIWEISNSVSFNAVERMVSNINSEMILTSQEGFYYNWDDNQGNTVTYSLFQNKVRFDLKEGLTWNEFELNNNSFTRFVREYFNKEWNYGEVIKKDLGDDMYIYYANRLTDDGVRIEMPSTFAETDYLILKEDKIISGDILLVDFLDFGVYAPLLDTRELSKYINLETYPKLVDIRLYDLVPVFSESITGPTPYLNPVFRDIMDEEKDCRALGTEVVYYYINFAHKFLTPIFKLDLECQYEYMDQLYYFGGIAYASAIDPNYISIPE